MEFYLKYLADNRPPKIKQTQPMSIGSSFDAYVKAYIVERLFGKRERFELKTIFEKQVEEHNRDWAWENGRYVFECYKRSGALADLMKELEHASAEPRFEFTVQLEVRGVPLLGKPDLWFITEDGLHVLIDWKVNGYCSRRAVSPKKGYLLCSDGWEAGTAPRSRSHRMPHKDAHPIMVKGFTINAACFLEDVDIRWADQTSIYGWLMGEEIGSKFVTGIDQIVASPSSPRPLLRIARHRTRVSEAYQQGLWLRVKKVWDTVQSGHIFDDLSREESDKRCETLNEYHKAYNGDDPNEKWFQEVTREHR